MKTTKSLLLENIKYIKKSLKYLSITFKRTIEHILNYIGENISKICHHENIYLNFTNKISSLYNFNDILYCQEHEQFFQTKMIGMVVKMMINHYCTDINRILHGKKKIRFRKRWSKKIGSHMVHISFETKKKSTRKIYI
jgi:hypothetical protein